MNLYHVTKFPPYFSPTLYCFYAKMSSFIPVLTIGIVLDSFYLLVFYSEKFSAWVWILPFAVNVNLNLSIDDVSLPGSPSCFWLVVWREKCIPKICFHQSDTLPRYRGETSGDVARCWLFFQAKDSTITRIFLYLWIYLDFFYPNLFKLFRPICTILNTTSLRRARPKMSQAWHPRYL